MGSSTGHVSRQTPATARVPAGASLLLGDMLLLRHVGEAEYEQTAQEALIRDDDALALVVLTAGRLRWRTDDGAGECDRRALLLLDLSRGFAIAAEAGADLVALFVPRDGLSGAAGAMPAPGVITGGASLGALQHLLLMLLDVPPRSAEPRASVLLADAIRQTAVAALVPLGWADRTRVGREHDLVNRCLAAIDAAPAEPFSIGALCQRIGCSRSALYRATEPMGGVAELVTRRKLANVHRDLRDASNRRGISAIARDHGFNRPEQFSRRFKQVFGTTASAVRDAARSGASQSRTVPLPAGRDGAATSVTIGLRGALGVVAART